MSGSAGIIGAADQRNTREAAKEQKGGETKSDVTCGLRDHRRKGASLSLPGCARPCPGAPEAAIGTGLQAKFQPRSGK